MNPNLHLAGLKCVIPTRKRDLVINGRPLIMGIVNVTPDSFYDGGKYDDLENAKNRIFKLEREGADIIDIGGESTRPGSKGVTAEQELKRVIPLIESVAPDLKVPISIDTQKALVAEEAIRAGADIINDISALGADENMAEAAAKHDVPLVLMHMQGTPGNMQENPHYEDLFGEIIAFLQSRIEKAVAAGVKKDKIIIDPGIGFGKTVEHNLEIIRDLWRLRALEKPILLGPSNKSFIGKVLAVEKDDRFEGTAASVVAAVLSGADILRLHEVAPMKPFAEMAAAIKNVEFKERAEVLK